MTTYIWRGDRTTVTAPNATPGSPDVTVQLVYGNQVSLETMAWVTRQVTAGKLTTPA